MQKTYTQKWHFIYLLAIILNIICILYYNPQYFPPPLIFCYFSRIMHIAIYFEVWILSWKYEINVNSKLTLLCWFDKIILFSKIVNNLKKYYNEKKTWHYRRTLPYMAEKRKKELEMIRIQRRIYWWSIPKLAGVIIHLLAVILLQMWGIIMIWGSVNPWSLMSKNV